LLRQYLDGNQIAELQRVVMLGPPNKGSQLADYVQSLEYLQPLTPQAVAQLGTDDASIPLQLGEVDFDLGVIAGTAWQAALLPGFPNEVSDGTVAVSETWVKGMQDFLEVPVSHTFLMWKPEVLAQVVYSLQHGVFDHNGAVG
jgi:triacylglycerol lipase